MTEPSSCSDLSRLSFPDCFENFILQITFLMFTLVSHERKFEIVFNDKNVQRTLFKVLCCSSVSWKLLLHNHLPQLPRDFLFLMHTVYFLVCLIISGYLFFLSVFPLFISTLFPALQYELCYVKDDFFLISL